MSDDAEEEVLYEDRTLELVDRSGVLMLRDKRGEGSTVVIASPTASMALTTRLGGRIRDWAENNLRSKTGDSSSNSTEGGN